MEKKGYLLLYTLCIVEGIALIILCVCGGALELVRGLLALSAYDYPNWNMEVAAYPKKIAYVIGRDTEIDLSGTVVSYTFGWHEPEEDEIYAYDDPIFEVDTSAVDLTKEGTYEVVISTVDPTDYGAGCILPIQVIAPQEQSAHVMP